MASVLKVDKLDPQSGTALEIGTSGDTITVPTGAGLTVVDEVKTNKISPSSGVAFTLGDSGDTFTIPSGATITNSGTATGFGKVLQVVQNTQGTALSTTSASWADMGWDRAITPSATSSKILVFGTLMMSSTNHGNFRCMRATTVIGSGDAASGSREDVSGYANCDGNTCRPQPFCILDSPSSTSSLTYKFQWIAYNSNTVYLNRTPNDTDSLVGSRSLSTLTLMEIGA